MRYSWEQLIQKIPSKLDSYRHILTRNEFTKTGKMIADVYANTIGCTFLLQIGSEKTDISLLLNIDKTLLLSYVFGPQLEQSITVLRHKEI